jgi:hypothetical protein
MQPLKWTNALIAVVGLCGTPLAASAAQRVQDRSLRSAVEQPAPGFMARTARKDPFNRLFAGTVTQLPVSSPESQIKPRVVCGTVLIPGNAGVDPKIRAEAPKTTTKFTMRGIQPQVCWPQ